MTPISLDYNPDFLKEEVRDGYTVSSEMKKLWLVELDMINKFTQVCDKYGIKYFADAGTLIGAVRHGGFIPWDDDVDLIMLREDFNKFRKIANDEFKYPYKVEWGVLRNSGFIMKIWKLDTTRVLEKRLRKYAYEPKCAFIDIFCLDYGPETREEQMIYYNALQIILNSYKQYNQLIRCAYHNQTFTDLRIQNMMDNLKKKYKLFDSKCQIYKDTKLLFNNNFINYHLKDGLMRYTEDYMDTVDFPYEMLTLKCPKGYERILDTIYTKRTGIPWQIPTQNLSYHNQTDKYFLDFNKPYTEYTKKFFDRNIDHNRILIT